MSSALRSGSEMEEEDEPDEESEESEAGGFQVNNMAFKSVEINKDLLLTEINSIRAHRWSIMENVADSYDFGLLYVNCKPYKELIIDHCNQLENTLAKHVRGEFME